MSYDGELIFIFYSPCPDFSRYSLWRLRPLMPGFRVTLGLKEEVKCKQQVGGLVLGSIGTSWIVKPKANGRKQTFNVAAKNRWDNNFEAKQVQQQQQQKQQQQQLQQQQQQQLQQ